jgi:hypothetical protein
MSKFQFELNEYRNVCHVYIDDLSEKPIDTICLIENQEVGSDNAWIPLRRETQLVLEDMTDDIEKVQDIYNKNYNKICGLYNKDLLLKDINNISGFYLSYCDHGEIKRALDVPATQKNCVTYTHDEAKGISALCQLSHILPVYNEGWKPDWEAEQKKWCIYRVNSEYKISSTFNHNMLLSFETEEKAKCFLSEEINLLVDLSNAHYI